MNLLGHIRRLRWLPRIALAVIALATLQIAFVRCAMAEQTTTGMSEHCLHCPQVSDVEVVVSCAATDANRIDVANAQQGSALIEIPLLAASVLILREPRVLVFPKMNISPPPQRPLNLTYCVQLK